MNMAQTLDVYMQEQKAYQLPVIVNIHGESILWGNGDKMWGGDTPFLSYLQGGSFACIKINYRLVQNQNGQLSCSTVKQPLDGSKEMLKDLVLIKIKLQYKEYLQEDT